LVLDAPEIVAKAGTILYRTQRKGFQARRKVAKVNIKQPEADAKNLKTPRVVPLRLGYVGARPGGEKKREIRTALSSEGLNP
jgi:hypothetical protein